MTLKRVKVVMLPTEKATALYLNTELNQLTNYHKPQQGGGKYSEIINQHLYFLSDDEIKEGDWFLQTTYQGIFQCVKTDNKYIYFGNDSYEPIEYCKKIIAATDSSLTLDSEELNFGYSSQSFELPQPSQDFIKVFVEQYNKGNVIEWVDVECLDIEECYNYNGEHIGKDCSCKGGDFRIVPKVNSKNEITIKKIKDSWSRDERDEDVIKALLSEDLIYSREEALQWISENL